MSKARLVSILLVTTMPLVACSRSQEPRGSSAETPAASPVATAAPSPSATAISGEIHVAEVDGVPIYASELEARVSGRLARLRQEEYEIRRQGIDEIVIERLLDAEAARRRISRDELLRREVDQKLDPVPAASVEELYEVNKARFAGSKKEALARIRETLEHRAQMERRQALESELRAKAYVTVELEAPRTPVALPPRAPVRGSTSAPVTIVEFTDYQCPYCHRAQSVMDQLFSTYQGKVRLVHLDFPLGGHPGAVPAARAARCAGEQNKFWEYHHDLMTAPGTLDQADLSARAAKLGLQPAPFRACLASDRFDTEIDADFARGEALGVTGTPAYFINGRMISGARPFEDFVRVIDAELALVGGR